MFYSIPANFLIRSANESSWLGLFFLGNIPDKLDLRCTDSLSDFGPLFLVEPTVALRVSCKFLASSGVLALAMASTIFHFCRSFKEASPNV
jgi:hypothetical protein